MGKFGISGCFAQKSVKVRETRGNRRLIRLVCGCNLACLQLSVEKRSD
jgi:hypothetical protein